MKGIKLRMGRQPKDYGREHQLLREQRNMLVSIVAFLAISTVDAVASGAVVAVRSHCCHVATRTWNESIEHHFYANFSGSWIPKNTCGTKASMAP